MTGQVAFVGSFPKESLCPKDGLPEYAFIGRSNVGKSSLINMLCQHKGLAKVSNKPGKTQTLNYFRVGKDWYLVDLPGYGYAKISKSMRAQWQQMIRNYLLHRHTLQCAFILLDANLPPQAIDVEFINWLGESSVPFVIVYTKTDKVRKSALQSHIEAIEAELLQHWEALPQTFITSAEKHLGRDEILAFIAQTNRAITT